MSTVSNEKAIPERPPFDVAWQTIDRLKVRYANGGHSGERIVLFSPWPESIFAFILEENVASTDVALTRDEIAELDAAV